MSLLNPVNKSYCLEQVCASNYEKLFRLIPDLCVVKAQTIGIAANNTKLYLQVIEQTPYTLTIELSHKFIDEPDELLEPAVRIRIYLDAQLAEVLSDHTRPYVGRVFKDFSLCMEIMNYKWRLNYFLQKWLDHCIAKNYQFTI
jgi:uncharacterized protein